MFTLKLESMIMILEIKFHTVTYKSPNVIYQNLICNNTPGYSRTILMQLFFKTRTEIVNAACFLDTSRKRKITSPYFTTNTNLNTLN